MEILQELLLLQAEQHKFSQPFFIREVMRPSDYILWLSPGPTPTVPWLSCSEGPGVGCHSSGRVSEEATGIWSFQVSQYAEIKHQNIKAYQKGNKTLESYNHICMDKFMYFTVYVTSI